jgi:pimeloyl-ACP methyl ester carboxylesterase
MLPAQHAIFVHGLWMPGAESVWFRRRLAQRFAIPCDVFRYPTVSDGLDHVAERLAEFARGIDASQVHWIGHSLGGVVLLRLFGQASLRPARSGRVVLLGAPVCGSLAARRVCELPGGRAAIGRIACEELLGERRPRFPPGRECGTIAGTQPLGLGRLFARFTEPNDGTVAVRETELEGAADRITLPVSHLGMMLSARTVDACGHFLRHGRFSDDDRPTAAAATRHPAR